MQENHGGSHWVLLRLCSLRLGSVWSVLADCLCHAGFCRAGFVCQSGLCHAVFHQAGSVSVQAGSHWADSVYVRLGSVGLVLSDWISGGVLQVRSDMDITSPSCWGHSGGFFKHSGSTDGMYTLHWCQEWLWDLDINVARVSL